MSLTTTSTTEASKYLAIYHKSKEEAAGHRATLQRILAATEEEDEDGNTLGAADAIDALTTAEPELHIPDWENNGYSHYGISCDSYTAETEFTLTVLDMWADVAERDAQIAKLKCLLVQAGLDPNATI